MPRKFVVAVLAAAVVFVLAGCSPAKPVEPGQLTAPKHGGQVGCAIVTAAEVSQISGVTFGKGDQVGPMAVADKSAPAITNTESCSYKNGDDVYVEYFLNTINQPAASYEAKVWKDDKTEEPDSNYVALGGQPAFRMVEKGQAGQNFVEFVFYRGQVVVQINTSGVPNGTAEKVAALVAKRM